MYPFPFILSKEASLSTIYQLVVTALTPSKRLLNDNI
jgi:hypothetical protein